MAFLKFGRRPPKNAPALRLAPLLTGVVPNHPDRIDHLAKLTDWRMLGNDAFGDCVAVTWANMRRLTTAALGTAEFYPSIEQVYALYRTQNPGFVANPASPGQDDGMDIQTCLEYLVKVGGPDGVKALAFAKVDARNLQQLDAAMAIFGSIWTGITVLAANEDEFDAGQPWNDAVAARQDAVAADVRGSWHTDALNDIRFITWAQEAGFADSFVRHEFDEAWVVVWPEHLGSKAFLEGVDLAQLAEDFTALTGRAFPNVTPTPAPTPTPPTPIPADADHVLADAVRAWSLARHSGANRLAAQAVQTWLKAKGL